MRRRNAKLREKQKQNHDIERKIKRIKMKQKTLGKLWNEMETIEHMIKV